MANSSRRTAFPLVVSLLAVLAGCGGGAQEPKTPVEAAEKGSGHAEVGKTAPDLSIHTLNGKGDISLASLQGKTVIVDFWATWCGPCKQSFPKLEELQRKMGDGVQILAISVDDDDKGILEFAKENGATFPIAWDEGHSIASRWKVETMPTTFIVDGAGNVRFIHAGYHSGETEEMAKEVAELASQRGSRVAKRDGDEPKPSDDGAAKAEEPKKEEVARTEEPPAAAAASDDEPPAVTPKKKAKKKGAGRSGGKAAPKKGSKKRA